MSAKQLLVLHQGAIGDFVLTLSVIQPLREALGADRVVAVAGASSARLAAGRSVIDEHYTPDQVGLYTVFREDGPIEGRLADLLESSDWVVSFLGPAGSASSERLAGASGGRLIFIDPRPTPGTFAGRTHITLQWLEAIREAGIDLGEPQPPRIRFDFQREPANDRKLRIVFHFGSGSPEKCWPLQRWMELSDTFQEVEILWVFGPAERELAQDFLELYRASPGRPDVHPVGEPDSASFARLLSLADLYVGNDAGMTHVAAALGVPTVALFGPTDPRVWRPLGEHVRVIATEQPGLPMERLSTEQVVTELNEVLSLMR